MRSLAVLLCLLCPAENSAEYVASAGVWALNTLDFTDRDISRGSVEVSALFDNRHWDVSVGINQENDYYRVDSWAYFSAQRVMRFEEILPVPLFAGLGLVARTHGSRVDELLSLPVSFSLSAGIDIGRVRVQLRHASNGGLHEPNRGANWLLIGYIFGPKE